MTFNLFFKMKIRGWRNGSIVEASGYSSEDLGLSSSTHVVTTPVPGFSLPVIQKVALKCLLTDRQINPLGVILHVVILLTGP